MYILLAEWRDYDDAYCRHIAVSNDPQKLRDRADEEVAQQDYPYGEWNHETWPANEAYDIDAGEKWTRTPTYNPKRAHDYGDAEEYVIEAIEVLV